MTKFLVGLTGGIGSGKSAAAERFAHHGIVCVDADIASRAVVEPGMPALQAIANHFGSHLVKADGSLDRTALRHLVFADDSKRRWLQGLLHPLISDYLREHIQAATSAYVILVNPLLFESRQNSWCNRVLVIDVPEALQITRTMSRDNNTREQVENIMRAQADRQQRLQAADDVIINDQDKSHLHAQVDQQHQRYLKLCQKHPA
jgi:dephospho-CoA kinase